MLQRSPITLVQVKAGYASENLLNEIEQILYLYLSKEIKKSIQCNEFNTDIIQNGYNIYEFNIVKLLILKDYHLIFQIK